MGAGNKTRVLCRRKGSGPSFSPALYFQPRPNCLDRGGCAHTPLGEGGGGSAMGIAIATVNLKVPSPSWFVPRWTWIQVAARASYAFQLEQPDKGFDTYGETVAQSGETQLSGLGTRKTPVLTGFLLRSRSPDGVRPPHFRPQWKRTLQSPKACAGHLSLQGRRTVGNLVHTFPGGRGGGGVMLGCQVLKGPLRWSREAVPGVCAGSSAGSTARIKGLVSSEGPVVGGERGSSKRVGSCSEQGQAHPFCSCFP